jgi:hypothetical protein
MLCRRPVFGSAVARCGWDGTSEARAAESKLLSGWKAPVTGRGLRSPQSCNYSVASQHFLEPEDSLPYSQEPSTGPYPESDQSSHPTPHKINFNTVHPPMSWFS